MDLNNIGLAMNFTLELMFGTQESGDTLANIYTL
jgi:hypothetical protein